ncbi:MAG TPA: helix-turn-helix domain-containing protein [Halomicronema sp.]
MKVNYQQIIQMPASELKLILKKQRTLTNRQKIQAFYWLKSGNCQSITEVSERLGVHRSTVQRWLKQYKDGGMQELLKNRQTQGRPRAISPEIVTLLTAKISDKNCEFKSYKEVQEWVASNYKVSLKYQTLYKHLHYRMKAKLKVPRRCSNKKDELAVSEFKKKSQSS